MDTFSASDPTTWPPDAESWFRTSVTCAQVNNRDLDFPPAVSQDNENSAIPGVCINKALHSLSLYDSPREGLSDLLYALPQWNLPPPASAADQHPWRVIWIYHPIIETFSANAGGKYELPDWTFHTELDETVQAEVPSQLDLNADHLLFHKSHRLVLYANKAVVRYKFANWIDSYLRERAAIPFVHDLRTRALPLRQVPPTVQAQCARCLQMAYAVVSGKALARDPLELAKYCDKWSIPFIRYQSTKEPPAQATKAPGAPKASTTAPLAKPPPASFMGSGPPDLSSNDFPPISPSPGKPRQKLASAPPPATLTGKTAPLNAAAMSAAKAAVPSTPTPAPPPPFPSDHTPAGPSPEIPSSSLTPTPTPPSASFPDVVMTPAATPAVGTSPPEVTTDESMEPTAPHPMDEDAPLSATRKASLLHLRPSVHPPVPPPAPSTIQQIAEIGTLPRLYELFADAFRPLPSLWSRECWQRWKCAGWELFKYLFPSCAPAEDAPLDTPLATLIDSYVNLPESFSDPLRLSAPQVAPEPAELPLLPCPSNSSRQFLTLLQFIHERVNPTLRTLFSHPGTHPPFYTFVVGSAQHPLAPAALHSHLVGCATSPPEIEHHATLYVPVGDSSIWPCPPDWAPLFVYLATALSLA